MNHLIINLSFGADSLTYYARQQQHLAHFFMLYLGTCFQTVGFAEI